MQIRFGLNRTFSPLTPAKAGAQVKPTWRSG